MRHRMIGRLTTLALSIVALSCGDVRSPLETAEPIPAVDSRPAGLIVFASRTTPLSKIATGTDVPQGEYRLEVTTELIRRNEGGRLNVSFPEYGSSGMVRVAKAGFKVEKNSIGDAAPLHGNLYQITMAVHSGEELTDVRIEFDPSGMSFSPLATLTTDIVGHIKAQDLVAYHFHSDGLVTQPQFSVEAIEIDDDAHEAYEDLPAWRITVGVPGFSEYTYDDDPMNEEGEEEP